MLLATPAGLEPATCRLEGGCSIQLSYGVGRALRLSSQTEEQIAAKVEIFAGQAAEEAT
jgi:hypothetical protein